MFSQLFYVTAYYIFPLYTDIAAHKDKVLYYILHSCWKEDEDHI